MTITIMTTPLFFQLLMLVFLPSSSWNNVTATFLSIHSTKFSDSWGNRNVLLLNSKTRKSDTTRCYDPFISVGTNRKRSVRRRWTRVESSSLSSTSPTDVSSSTTSLSSMKEKVLHAISHVNDDAKQYTTMFDLSDAATTFYSLFAAIRSIPVPLGMYGTPFILRHDEIQTAMGGISTHIRQYYTMKDLQTALEDDFLDASRGSTDNRKGWQVRYFKNLLVL
jgi:hypothetical protein